MSYTHPEYRLSLSSFFRLRPAPALLARGTEGEAVADARRLHRIGWMGDAVTEGAEWPRAAAEAEEGTLTDLPELPSGEDARATAAFIRSALEDPALVPKAIRRQVDVIAALP